MKTAQGITAEEVKALSEYLLYDPTTGVFTWRVHRSPNAKAGSVAGAIARGYIHIHVGKRRDRTYKAHRLAYAFTHGSLEPGTIIDHVNGVKTDNRICNIRVGTQTVNCENLHRPRKDNRSGFLGVFKNWNRWSAKIQVDRKPVDLGTFDTPEEAHQAYLEAKRRLHPGCTI